MKDLTEKMEVDIDTTKHFEHMLENKNLLSIFSKLKRESDGRNMIIAIEGYTPLRHTLAYDLSTILDKSLDFDDIIIPTSDTDKLFDFLSNKNNQTVYINDEIISSCTRQRIQRNSIIMKKILDMPKNNVFILSVIDARNLHVYIRNSLNLFFRLNVDRNEYLKSYATCDWHYRFGIWDEISVRSFYSPLSFQTYKFLEKVKDKKKEVISQHNFFEENEDD